MDRFGMNAEAIESLAGQLEGQAAAIQNTLSTVDGLVARALFEWQGRGAQDFSGHWHNSYKPALLRSLSSVSGLAESARRNAAEQRGTSGESNGVTAVSVATGLLTGTLAIGSFTKIVDQHEMWRKISNYPNLGRLGRGLASFEKWISGPATRTFDRFVASGHSANLFGEVLKKVPGPIAAVGSAYDVTTSSEAAIDAFQQGDAYGGIYAGADAAGAGLQALPTPVTYLGGTAIRTWDTAAQGLVEAWGEPGPKWSDVVRYGPLSFVDALKTVWGDL